MSHCSAPLSGSPTDKVRQHERDSHAVPTGVGRTVGKYLLSSQLGRGGMGVVFRATDVELDREVAVKLLAHKSAADATGLERFLRESRSAARLQHPNVVAVYDSGEVEGVPYIVMELCLAGSAQDYLTVRGALPWFQATRVAGNVCRGLAAAHAAGLVHRDIKPGNILFARHQSDRHGFTAKIADFGLARTSGGLSSASTLRVLGTPDYMSPEQCRGEPLDERTDIYSLGATYFALLTARTPYPRLSAMQVMFAHCNGPPPDPREVVPNLPDACARVVRRAMAVQPSARYPSARAMLDDLKATAKGLMLAPAERYATVPVNAVRPTPSRATQRPRLGPRVKSWAAIAAGLVVGIAFLMWYGSEPGEAAEESAARILNMCAPVEAVAFAPDGRTLAAGALCGNAIVRVWDLVSGREVFAAPTGRQGRALAFSQDGTRLLVGHRDGIDTWTCADCRRVESVRVGPNAGVELLMCVGSHYRVTVAVDPPGGVGEPSRQLWDYRPGEPLRSLSADVGNVCCSAFAATGGRMAVGTREGRLSVGGPAVELGYRPHKLAFSPDGETLAVASEGGIELWAADGRTRLAGVPHGRGEVRALAFAPDGRTLAVANGDGLRWGAVTLFDVTQLPRSLDLPLVPACVRAVAFAPDGQSLAAGGSDQVVRVWNLGEINRR